MAIPQNELFYGGYNPAVWCSGYDEEWILGKESAPDVSKPATPAPLREDGQSARYYRRAPSIHEFPMAPPSHRYPAAVRQTPAYIHRRTATQENERQATHGPRYAPPAQLYDRESTHSHTRNAAPPLFSHDTAHPHRHGAEAGPAPVYMFDGERAAQSPYLRNAVEPVYNTSTQGFQASSPVPIAKDEARGIVKLKVPMCCEGCANKVKKKLKAVQGVAFVECNMSESKVIVRGTSNPEALLAKVKKIQSRSEFWIGED